MNQAAKSDSSVQGPLQGKGLTATEGHATAAAGGAGAAGTAAAARAVLHAAAPSSVSPVAPQTSKRELPSWLNSKSWAAAKGGTNAKNTSSSASSSSVPSSSPPKASSNSSSSSGGDSAKRAGESKAAAAATGLTEVREGSASNPATGRDRDRDIPTQTAGSSSGTRHSEPSTERTAPGNSTAGPATRRPVSEGSTQLQSPPQTGQGQGRGQGQEDEEQQQLVLSPSALLAAAGEAMPPVPLSPPAPVSPPPVEPFTLATSSAADHAYEKRVNRFYVEISRAKVNLPELRRLAVHGIPNEGSLRAMTWKILLGYLPPVREEWDSALSKKRAQYAQFTAELLLSPTDIEKRRSREASSPSDHRSTVERWDSVPDDSIRAGVALGEPQSSSGQGEEEEEEEEELAQDVRGVHLKKGRSTVAKAHGEGEVDGVGKAELRQSRTALRRSQTSPGERESTSGSGSALPMPTVAEGVEDHPLSCSPSSLWHQFFQDSEVAEQILRDIRRTHPELPFFMKGDGEVFTPAQEAMRRLLMVFAKLNPGIRYVQGMNEVLAPIVYVFMTDPDQEARAHAEADSFFCFVEVLSDFRDFFCQQLDNSAVGIRSAIHQLSDLLRSHDEELWRTLTVICKLDPQYFAFRWITLLLTQEFGFPQILRIWDAILGSPDGPMAMLLRICCAMLMCVRDLLLVGDFATNLKLLQKYPPANVERILHTAERLRGPAF